MKEGRKKNMKEVKDISIISYEKEIYLAWFSRTEKILGFMLKKKKIYGRKINLNLVKYNCIYFSKS